jgi:hypothetical protein
MFAEPASDGVDLGGFQGFLQTQGRKDGGQALGQHGFAGAWRANHDHIVATCSSNL